MADNEKLTDAEFADLVLKGAEISSAHALPVALTSRILADFDVVMAPRPSWLKRLSNMVWPGAPLWQPSLILAASLACGLALGTLLPVLQSTVLVAASSTGQDSALQMSEATPALDMSGDL